MTNEDCIFCRIVKGEVPCEKIWEDEKYLAFLSLGQINPGHTLLIPKKHSDYLFDLNDDEYSTLMSKAKEIAELLKEKLNPKRIGMAVEGFMIPHIHIHLVPVNEGNELNPERAKEMNAEELKKIADIIRSRRRLTASQGGGDLSGGT